LSRPQRSLRKIFTIYCEGDTEYHYINHMRKNQGVELSLKPVNMKGGGYLNFLDHVKSDAKNNCLAKFIIVDADKARDDLGERKNLKLLIDYCSLQNKKGAIPHFLILDSPDFEYVACLHDPNYKNQDTERYIRTVFGFQSLETFKKYEKIYEFLNSDGRSYKDMIGKTKAGECIIRQRYTISKKRFDVRITQTQYDPEKYWTRGSNIFEFFDVIDW